MEKNGSRSELSHGWVNLRLGAQAAIAPGNERPWTGRPRGAGSGVVHVWSADAPRGLQTFAG
jgi:hypothetical protein